MYSILPVPEDRAGAIITLVGLGHERRGYAGRLGYARAWGSSRLCQTGYHQHPYQSSDANTIVQYQYVVASQHSNSKTIGPSTSMNKMCQPQISNMFRKIDRTVFIAHRCEKSPRSDR